MGTIKGQHLRLFINNVCVAAAKSCSLHLASVLEDSSTKDTEGDFAEQSVVGLNWDASVDALVTNGQFEEATLNTDTEYPGSGGAAYYSAHAFVLQPGETIWINSADASVGFATASSPLTDLYSQSNSYTNEGSSAMTVYALSDTEDAEVEVYITDTERTGAQELIAAWKNKTIVGVKLATTNGRNNIKEDTLLLIGTAIINDISLVAANRTNSTYTVQLQGTGDLATEEE